MNETFDQAYARETGMYCAACMQEEHCGNCSCCGVMLPAGWRLSITYQTIDQDPGDPEVGPSPDIDTIAIEYELRQHKPGIGWWPVIKANYVVDKDIGELGPWRTATNASAQDQLHLVTGGGSEYIAVCQYMHQEGLI